jgi:hypothetical protein
MESKLCTADTAFAVPNDEVLRESERLAQPVNHSEGPRVRFIENLLDTDNLLAALSALRSSNNRSMNVRDAFAAALRNAWATSKR